MKIQKADSLIHTGNALDTHPAFELLRTTPIETLNVVLEEYRHKRTLATHFHLASENEENVFLVALRTFPMNSTGVAHILEHTVLCGSEKYPVRDPFFMMIRRSLNTFMNAFTSSDWTAYPFASQNKKDFNNLLDVYLDAVFFARLHELDFAQEGHRVEFDVPNDPNTNLVFKGVVYNEMKGAMSSPVSTLWQTLTKYLFPTTTYHFNSGGEPSHIPDLSYAQLVEFYKRHYHPSNAIFMTYGNIPASEHQQKMEQKALARFDFQAPDIQISDEKRYIAPITVTEHYALDSNQETKDKTHIVMGWLWGHSSDLQAKLQGQLLSGVLLDNGASPLRRVLESTDLGAAPSPICGLESSNREMSFICGIEGSNAGNEAALEKLILETLEKVATEGIPADRVESVLHQLELSQREVSGGGYPYGLHLILDGLSAAVHGGDPVEVLNLDAEIEKLREQCKDDRFIKHLVRSLLLDNPHRVRLTLIPDTQLNARANLSEQNRLAAMRSSMSDEQTHNIIRLADALKQRQMEVDDVEILPKVEISDIPSTTNIPKGVEKKIASYPVSIYDQGTNGIVYQQIFVDLPHLDEEQLFALPYYTGCLTELGCGGRNYLDTQAYQDAVSGGISAFTTIRGAIDDIANVKGYFVLSGKALASKIEDFNQLMFDTLASVSFEEMDRIREIIAQQRARMEQSVTGNGHVLAMSAATSGLSPIAALSHKLRGLEGIRAIKTLDDGLNEKSNIEKLSATLVAIQNKLLAAPKQFLVVGEHDNNAVVLDTLSKNLQDFSSKEISANEFQSIGLPNTRSIVKSAWVTSTQVNFCAKAFPTVAVGHPDAPALSVLGTFLKNGFLHRAIREQGGAYGGGASYESDDAAFRFYSYRDPRIEDTLLDFDRSIDWLLTAKHDHRQLEEAILGVIGSIDKPSSPAGEAKFAFHSKLFGRDEQQRQAFRQRILSVTIDDLVRVCESYLTPEKANTAVITNNANAALCQKLELQIIDL